MQITCLVVLDKKIYHLLLLGILGIGTGKFQILNNLAERFTILTIGCPALLIDSAVLTLHKGRVHAMHNGTLLVAFGLDASIECLGLGLGNTLIVVAGAGKHQILSLGLVHTLGHHFWIEEHLGKFFAATCLGDKPFA